MNDLLPVRVLAEWDPDAEVWVATSSEIHGLAVEAESLAELTVKVRQAIQDLEDLNAT